MRHLFAAMTAAGLAGCVMPQQAFRSPEAIPLQTTWSMPWQLDPESETSRSNKEQIYVADVPEIGRVRGTKAAITYVRAPLTPVDGRNRTAAPCRELLAKEALKHGAARVEVASLGPERPSGGDTFEGPVGVRILYPGANGYQVRQAALLCRVDRKGTVLATPVLNSNPASFANLSE